MSRFVLGLIALVGCGACSGDRFSDLTKFDEFVGEGARILFVGAHPDDETLVGAYLAYGCIENELDCHIAIFTRGESGMCALDDPVACADLGATRAAEMARVAERYHASIHQGEFSNGPSNAPTDEDRVDEIRQRWQDEGDPEAWIFDIVEEVAPDLVLTLDPDNGFTGHFEHRLASRLAKEALVAGAAPEDTALFYTLNHYEALEPLTGRDPGEATEAWRLRRDCGGTTCLDVSVEIARTHASQASSILALLILFPDEFEFGYLGYSGSQTPSQE